MKTKIKDMLLNHKIRLFLILLFIFLIAPFLLLIVMRTIENGIKTIPDWIAGFTRLEDGINVWFTFWGSYAGAITTMLLSVCAMYLSVKFERANEKNAMIQQAMAFHQFQIKEVELYDLKQCFPVKILDKFEDVTKGDYIIKIQFEKSFPPYFDVNVEDVEWRDSKSNFRHLEYISSVMESNIVFNIYLLLAPEDEQRYDINYFYHINYYEPQVMLLRERTRCLRLYLKCENQMDFEKNKDDAMKLMIDIELENEDFYKNHFISLAVLNRQVAYTKEKGQKYD